MEKRRKEKEKDKEKQKEKRGRGGEEGWRDGGSGGRKSTRAFELPGDFLRIRHELQNARISP